MPHVSVVITWRYGSASLADMLRVQLPQHESPADLDMIVVTAEPPTDEVTEMFPDLRFITATPETPVGRMRSIGLEQALGSIVMLIDGSPDGAMVERARELIQ
jgi:hypothetical protein